MDFRRRGEFVKKGEFMRMLYAIRKSPFRLAALLIPIVLLFAVQPPELHGQASSAMLET